MYQIKLSKRAKRELKVIRLIYQTAVGEAFEVIKENPFLGKPLTRELTGRFSYRIGVYRIIYKVSQLDKRVYIITVGHRAKVYE